MGKAEENRRRRALRSLGYALSKDRRRHPETRQGGYRIVHLDTNSIAAGEDFDLDALGVATFIGEKRGL